MTDVESSRVTPVNILAHLFGKLDTPLLCACLDLLSDTIVVCCGLYESFVVQVETFHDNGSGDVVWLERAHHGGAALRL